MALDGLDRLIERPQIKPRDEVPDHSRAVVGRQPGFEIDGPPLQLCPVWPLDPRLRVSGFAMWLVCIRQRKEGVIHERSVAARPAVTRGISSQPLCPRKPSWGRSRRGPPRPPPIYIRPR